MPSFVRAVYRRCLPNKSLYRSLCLCSCAVRGTNPPMIRLVGNETTALPLRCPIQRGKLEVMVMQSIRGKHVQVGGVLPLHPRCPVSIQIRLIVRDSHHKSRKIDESFTPWIHSHLGGRSRKAAN